MSNNEETHICDNCKFSQFGDKYKKGAFEGMCQNQNIPSERPYPSFPHILRTGTCHLWQQKQKK